MTQYNIDENSDDISRWIASKPKDGERLDIRVPETPYGDSGRSIDKAAIQKDEFPVEAAKNVKGVETRLVYRDDLDPPFTVMTSMPKDVPTGGN
jgi:hypothetical protein